MNDPALPPGQRLAAPCKWPYVGERQPRSDSTEWAVKVCGRVQTPRTWSLRELADFPQSECTVDIHCVTRWSMLGTSFRGALLQTILEAAQPESDARFVSFVARSERSHSTSLPLETAIDLGTLLATHWNDLPLPTDHGGPIRTIVPQRYFYKSLKWLERIEVLAEDCLGYWESTAGYHNQANPWQEERYVTSRLNPSLVRELLVKRDISSQELLGLNATGWELTGLNGRHGILRNARFLKARLAGANFAGANLSNASFVDADLRGASFVDADCEGADFCGADLDAADFGGSSLFGASFLPAADSTGVLPARITPRTRFDDAALRSLEVTPEQLVFVQSRLQ